MQDQNAWIYELFLAQILVFTEMCVKGSVEITATESSHLFLEYNYNKTPYAYRQNTCRNAWVH